MKAGPRSRQNNFHEILLQNADNINFGIGTNPIAKKNTKYKPKAKTMNTKHKRIAAQSFIKRKKKDIKE